MYLWTSWVERKLLVSLSVFVSKCTYGHNVTRTKHSVPGRAFLSSPRGRLPVEVLSLAGQVGQPGWAAGAAAGLRGGLAVLRCDHWGHG